jgi:hypothetical protein
LVLIVVWAPLQQTVAATNWIRRHDDPSRQISRQRHFEANRSLIAFDPQNPERLAPPPRLERRQYV